MTIYLYVKTHNKTGLKYLGQTKNEPFKYKGSGKYWKRHIKLHGNDATTEVLLVTENKDELRAAGLHFSNLWDVVRSPDWANLMPESGHVVTTTDVIRSKISTALSGRKLSDETRAKISAAKRNPSIETREKLRKAASGKKFSSLTRQRMSESHIGKKYNTAN